MQTLDCISVQTYRNFEVIVIDASDAPEQVEEIVLSRFSFPLDYVRYGIPGNVSKQRNLALERATGDICLFLDDDVNFDQHLLSNYIVLFEGEKYEAISGVVETEKYRKGSPPIKFSGVFSDLGGKNIQPCDFIAETNIICTANFAFRRIIYERIGGFDENMYGLFDDVDFGLKLIRNNVVIVHHPLVSVYHYQAKASGARSSSLPDWWAFYNISYFHLKNRRRNRLKYFVLGSWEILKPSRAWLEPTALVKRYNRFRVGCFRAASNLNSFVEN